MTRLQATYQQELGKPLRQILLDALADAATIDGAAGRLGIGRQTFYRWCAQEGIDPGEELRRSRVAEVA